MSSTHIPMKYNSNPTYDDGLYVVTPLVFTPEQWKWVEDMSGKHRLSLSKVIRCCVTCVAVGDAKEFFPTKSETSLTQLVALAEDQAKWLEAKKGRVDASSVVKSCMETDEYTVFGVIRCKKLISDCEGAQKAVEYIKEKYGKGDGEVEVKENINISNGMPELEF